METMAVLAVYSGGFVFTYRRMFVAMQSADERGSYASHDPEWRVMNAVFAMLLSTMWPLVLVGFALWRFVTPVTPGERKAELDEREREIVRLERELGIGRQGPP